VWDVFWERVLRADGCDIFFLASFRECIIARIKVFAFLGQYELLQDGEKQDGADFELVLKKIFLVGQFAVETEELLLLLVEGLIHVLAISHFANGVVPTLMSTLFF